MQDGDYAVWTAFLDAMSYINLLFRYSTHYKVFKVCTYNEYFLLKIIYLTKSIVGLCTHADNTLFDPV